MTLSKYLVFLKTAPPINWSDSSVVERLSVNPSAVNTAIRVRVQALPKIERFFFIN